MFNSKLKKRVKFLEESLSATQLIIAEMLLRDLKFKIEGRGLGKDAEELQKLKTKKQKNAGKKIKR